MKKLTAGIFATILGVTAMGAADAAVTSKGYVDTAVGAVAQSVTDLGTTVADTYATKQALADEKSTLQQNINAVALVANAAATKAEVGTPDEGKTVVGMIKDVEAKAYDDTAVRSLITGNTTAIQGLETNKADKSTTYTKTETDGLLSAKANSADVYTKEAADAAFATAAQGTKADTAVQPAAINDMATMTWVEGKGYLTEHQNLAEYAKTADVVTNDEFTTFETSNTAAIEAAQKAGDDAAAVAAENAKDIAALETAATSYELKANVSGAAETTTGKYVLTKIDDGQGNVSFGWELIDRDYTVGDSTPNNQ